MIPVASNQWTWRFVISFQLQRSRTLHFDFRNSKFFNWSIRSWKTDHQTRATLQSFAILAILSFRWQKLNAIHLQTSSSCKITLALVIISLDFKVFLTQLEFHSNGVTPSRYCSDLSISWPDLSIYFGHPNQRSLGLESWSTIPIDSLEKKKYSHWFKALEMF